MDGRRMQGTNSGASGFSFWGGEPWRQAACTGCESLLVANATEGQGQVGDFVSLVNDHVRALCQVYGFCQIDLMR